MSEAHDEYCPAGLVEHIADIEAGWTLRKPWKEGTNEATEKAEQENVEAIRVMLERWQAHGIIVVEDPAPGAEG